MILLLTEYQWKLEPVQEDGSLVLDIVPTVGGNVPIRLSIDSDTRAKLAEQLRAAECSCGEPGTPGVVHRLDGPCYEEAGEEF